MKKDMDMVMVKERVKERMKEELNGGFIDRLTLLGLKFLLPIT